MFFASQATPCNLPCSGSLADAIARLNFPPGLLQSRSDPSLLCSTRPDHERQLTQISRPNAFLRESHFMRAFAVHLHRRFVFFTNVLWLSGVAPRQLRCILLADKCRVSSPRSTTERGVVGSDLVDTVSGAQSGNESRMAGPFTAWSL